MPWGARAAQAPAPVKLTILAGEQPAAPAKLVGPDGRLQLIVTAEFDSNRPADATESAAYSVSPSGIVQVSRDGVVTPRGNGAATITAKLGALEASAQLTVEHFDDPPPVSFPNQVVPVFTKLGCNGGGCHGKSSGQNGFALSLLGFEPPKDYEYLVKEERGRRLFPSAPDSSLLLLKATNTLPHGGGERLKLDGHDYRLLRRWIAQGMPAGTERDPAVSSIEVFPRHRVMGRDGVQRLKVLARYGDGSVVDVTETAQYESANADLAKAQPSGRVAMLGQPGDVAVMVRYQTFVGAFAATVPLGAPVDKLPPARNFIDELVFSKLRELGMPPSEIADDATFVRRVSLDIAGRLPDPQRVREFLADPAVDKRNRYIDELLDSPGYADYFASKWSAILRNRRPMSQIKEGTYAFHQWLRTSLLENKRYDVLVRELLTASGPISRNPAVSWYRQVDQMNEQVEDTAQLFLGVRIQCARCHHHPFEKWSQDDYYGLAAYFSRIGRKGPANGQMADDFRVVHKRGDAKSRNPNSGKDLSPAALGDPARPMAPDQDPRRALADWMASPDNPFFAKSLVNRYWKHFFGRGLVDPEDDMRATNPPANPQLLDALAKSFADSRYDMKQLIRTICRSSTYQLSAVPNPYNGSDKQAFARYYPKRLSAEVLLDAVDDVTGSPTDFADLPKGARAIELPDHTDAAPAYFLQVFGRPAGSSACECERTDGASLPQSLHLINSADVNGKIASGRCASLATEARSDIDKVTDLYYRAFSRPPREQELSAALAHLSKPPTDQKRQAYEDIVWALINTKEFLFNH